MRGSTLFVLALMMLMFSCNENTKKNSTSQIEVPAGSNNEVCCGLFADPAVRNDSTILVENRLANHNVKAYYFHNKMRCKTCLAVEQVTASILNENYKGKIILQTISLDEESGKSLAKSLGVEGQTLIFTRGNHKIDLTSKAFLYAVNKRDRLQDAIITAVQELNDTIASN